MTTTTVLNERYELRRRLYSEGNQAAYEAIDRVRRETVLLVLVPPAAKLGGAVDDTVRADIEHAFGVSAPSLLPLINMNEDSDYRFLVMPMPEGVNAWERITRGRGKQAAKPMTPDQALRTADDLMEAARAAHANQATLGFSPHQVWIDERGHARVQYYWLERVRLAAKVGTESRPARFQTMAIEGAPFQAPEITKGQEGAAPPADQFFIGAILYGLLTGQVPGGSLSPIRSSRPDVPKPMAQAIERALSREPAKRHADLDAMRRALYRRPAGRAALVPLLLLLLTLWAGHALMRGGARLDDWAFAAEMEARRDSAFAASRPQAEPVPRPTPVEGARFAGVYASGDDPVPVHTLTLQADGSFHHRDRSKEVERETRGVWWLAADEALRFTGIDADGGVAPARRADIVDGSVRWPLDDGSPVALSKRKWRGGKEGGLRSLALLREPLPDTVIADGDVRVVGDVAAAGVTVRVGGTEVPVVGTRFDTVWKPRKTGAVELVVEAIAADGFTETQRRTVRIDRTPPAIEATAALSQVDGIWQLAVAGRATDDDELAAVSVNDEPVKLDAEGGFRFERKGADAEGHAFVEIVAVDRAGRAGRRLVWADVVPIEAASLEERFATARAALEEGRTGEGEMLLRDLRGDGGLIEQLDPDVVASLVRSGRAPRISLDDYPLPPSWFENDGTQMIELSGELDWFAPGDKLTVAGIEVAVTDGRFTARTQCPRLGKNEIRIQVMRADVAVETRDVEVWLAAPDGDVPSWTGVPVSNAQRAASARYGLPIGHQNEQGMRFVLVPPGAFQRQTNDGRSFEVRITRPFYMQMREVARTAFERSSARTLPRRYTFPGGDLPIDGPDRPAAGVTRADAIAFAQRLTSAGKGSYRLPTEAEWELAARAGDAYGAAYWRGDRTQVATWANFADRSVQSILPRWPVTKLNMLLDDGHAGPWPVGSGAANAYGLRDMLGNVFEWVADWYAPHDSSVVEDPKGPLAGTEGVVRGGSFRMLDTDFGFGARREAPPANEMNDVGFRLVYEPGGR
ncbi:MAG: SUMF1/EgtB/PvdO family nonheme iron enzyme [Planctomycetota bacterium]|nr:SUMF1/EgtB/PvdO family nonheme iron enzyme [Planctomycetota bacterium]